MESLFASLGRFAVGGEAAEKQAVSARWVARMIGNGLRSRYATQAGRSLLPDFQRAVQGVNRWAPGAARRATASLDAVGPSRPRAMLRQLNAQFPDFHRALPRYLPTGSQSTLSQVVGGLRDRLGLRPPTGGVYNIDRNAVFPGRNWFTALHEYGHYLDRPALRYQLGRPVYGAEVVANRNASQLLRGWGGPRPAGLPSPLDYLRTANKQQLEGYRLGQLQNYTTLGPRVDVSQSPAFIRNLHRNVQSVLPEVRWPENLFGRVRPRLPESAPWSGYARAGAIAATLGATGTVGAHLAGWLPSMRAPPPPSPVPAGQGGP